VILLDKEDVERLDLWKHPFYRRWDTKDPEQVDEAIALGWPDILADGPFLLVVHDEAAWAGQAGRLLKVAGRRIDPPNHKWWSALADMYADDMGVSRQSLLLRYASIRRYLRSDRRGQWCSWEKVYHWPDEGDLVWSALVHGHHPWLEVREDDENREVRYKDR
jgi:hypothetical protein